MTQPEALRLADRLRDGWGLQLRKEAEAELRRLHAQRDALLEALRLLNIECHQLHHNFKDRHDFVDPCPVVARIKAAIKAAEGEHMTDRELLELAAKAAGVELQDDHYWRDGFWTRWNPLTDDGDALRLAVKLEIDICPSMRGSSKFRYAVYDRKTYGEVDSEPLAATRRAIVRAAAEIGRLA